MDGVRSLLVVVLLISIAFIASVSAAGTLYGFASTTLFSYDTTCGSSKVVSTPKFFSLHTDNQCSIDQLNGIFYANGFNTSSGQNLIIGVKLSNGAVSSITPIQPGLSGIRVDFDSNTKQLIYTGQNATTSNWQTYVVTPGVSNAQLIATIDGGFINVLGGPSSFDPNTNTQWISMGTATSIVLVGVNIITGNWTQVSDAQSLETMAYNINTQNIVGIGIQVVDEVLLQRTIVQVNPAGVETLSANVTGGWTILFGGGSAFDPSSNTLYSTLSIGRQSPLLFLTGLNVKNGATKTAALLTENLAPWCLEWMPSNNKKPSSISHHN